MYFKYSAVFNELDIDPNFGLVDLEAKIQSLPVEKRSQINADIESCLEAGPDLYMVNSDRGISNLHVSSDTIIDASMPALIRGGGKGWGPDGEEADCKCVIPDSSYAAVYAETINFCKEHGADPSEMGTVPNVGLMADKAEEYGSIHRHLPRLEQVKFVSSGRPRARFSSTTWKRRYLADVHDQR